MTNILYQTLFSTTIFSSGAFSAYDGRFWGNSAWVASFEKSLYYDRQQTSFASMFPNYARASAATYTYSNGTIQTAAIDEPRFDYSTGTRALLLEVQRTNIIEYSEMNTTAGWEETGAIVTQLSLNRLNVFDGVSIESTGATWNRYNANPRPSVTSGTTYAVTLWYEGGTSGSARLLFRDIVGGTETRVLGSVGSLAVTLTDAGTVTIEEQTIVSGVYRMKVLYTPNFTGSLSIGLGPDSGVSGETVIGLGLQFELGDKASSYIPTSGAAATRAADIGYSDISALSLGSGFTVYAKARVDSAPGGFDRIIQLDDGDTNNGIVSYYRDSSSDFRYFVLDGGVTQAAEADTSGIALGDIFKTAIRVETNNINVSYDGNAGTNDISCTYTEPTYLYLCASNTSTSAKPTVAYIYEIAIYETPLSDAELESITT